MGEIRITDLKNYPQSADQVCAEIKAVDATANEDECKDKYIQVLNELNPSTDQLLRDGHLAAFGVVRSTFVVPAQHDNVILILPAAGAADGDDDLNFEAPAKPAGKEEGGPNLDDLKAAEDAKRADEEEKAGEGEKAAEEKKAGADKLKKAQLEAVIKLFEDISESLVQRTGGISSAATTIAKDDVSYSEVKGGIIEISNQYKGYSVQVKNKDGDWEAAKQAGVLELVELFEEYNSFGLTTEIKQLINSIQSSAEEIRRLKNILENESSGTIRAQQAFKDAKRASEYALSMVSRLSDEITQHIISMKYTLAEAKPEEKDVPILPPDVRAKVLAFCLEEFPDDNVSRKNCFNQFSIEYHARNIEYMQRYRESLSVRDFEQAYKTGYRVPETGFYIRPWYISSEIQQPTAGYSIREGWAVGFEVDFSRGGRPNVTGPGTKSSTESEAVFLGATGHSTLGGVDGMGAGFNISLDKDVVSAFYRRLVLTAKFLNIGITKNSSITQDPLGRSDVDLTAVTLMAGGEVAWVFPEIAPDTKFKFDLSFMAGINILIGSGEYVDYRYAKTVPLDLGEAIANEVLPVVKGTLGVSLQMRYFEIGMGLFLESTIVDSEAIKLPGLGGSDAYPTFLDFSDVTDKFGPYVRVKGRIPGL